MSSNPYDQLPYHSQPIEWAAPERLALTSLLHGGPLPELRSYRVLELGCGDGANLIPLAYYRPQAEFIGLDGSATHIQIAQSRLTRLGLDNLTFLQLDFQQAKAHLTGQFDFILMHGVLSWVSDTARDSLLRLCHERLKWDGLLYLNYNSKPGWSVRGLVRDYLLAHTQDSGSLSHQLEQTLVAASKMVRSLAGEEHPFAQLMSNEFRFICNSHHSYVAHEFLAKHNKAYWRSEFLTLVKQFNLHVVAEADYNYPSGRIDPSLPERIKSQNLIGVSLEDTVDLMSYRQIHAPLLCKRPVSVRQPATNQLPPLQVASCLQPVGPHRPCWYRHPSGYQVEAKETGMAKGLDRLWLLWPRSVSLEVVFEQHERYLDDLLLLHRNGLLELRLPEMPDDKDWPEMNRLNEMEWEWGGYYTTANHLRIGDKHHVRMVRRV